MAIKPTGAKPRDVGGHIWRCYSTGIMRTEWRTDDGLLAVGRYETRSTYWARAGDYFLPRRFRTDKAAMLAAIKETKP